MEIRKTRFEDVDRVMEIYAFARAFMAANGNPNQWGATNWPPRELILEDIKAGNSYICEVAGRIEGVFYFIHGEDIEPTYREIDGMWLGDNNYGVIHRMAASGNVRGVGSSVIKWAINQCEHIRIDTHPDNKPMQRLLNRLGFQKCGVIHVIEDNDPRFAYEYIK